MRDLAGFVDFPILLPNIVFCSNFTTLAARPSLNNLINVPRKNVLSTGSKLVRDNDAINQIIREIVKEPSKTLSTVRKKNNKNRSNRFCTFFPYFLYFQVKNTKN